MEIAEAATETERAGDDRIETQSGDETIPGKHEALKKVLKSMGREEDYTHVADLFGVIADATRLRLIVALASSPLCVSDLSRVVSLGQSATSHALRILRDRGIVQAERRGQQVIYQLSNRSLNPLIAEGWRQALEDVPPKAVVKSDRGSGDMFTGEIHLEPKGKDKKKKKKKKKNHRNGGDES